MYDPDSPLLRPAKAPGRTPPPEARARFAEDRLLDAVIRCELRPGETVTEAGVMARFGLTRAAARAGLTHLGHDGWAAPQARTGWRVLPVTGALIGQVLAARRIAEPALAGADLSRTARADLTQIAALLAPLRARSEAGAITAVRHHVDRVDALLLGAIDPFTARHLRKLWDHSARVIRFLEEAGGTLYHRAEVTALIHAMLGGDRNGIVAARAALIDSQETFLLRQLLRSDAPLTPGGGVLGREKQPAAHRRDR